MFLSSAAVPKKNTWSQRATHEKTKTETPFAGGGETILLLNFPWLGFFFRETLNWAVLSVLTSNTSCGFKEHACDFQSPGSYPELLSTGVWWKSWDWHGCGREEAMTACQASLWQIDPHLRSLQGPQKLQGCISGSLSLNMLFCGPNEICFPTDVPYCLFLPFPLRITPYTNGKPWTSLSKEHHLLWWAQSPARDDWH